jgi:hypothetical protein
LADEALAIWRAWFNAHNLETQRVGTDEERATAARHEELPARLALLLHLMAWGGDASSQRPQDVISASTLTSAIEAAGWFRREEQRVVTNLRRSSSAATRESLLELLRRRYRDGLTPRELANRHQTLCRSTRIAEQRLDAFVRQGHGVWRERPTTARGGRPTREFVPTPAGGPLDVGIGSESSAPRSTGES